MPKKKTSSREPSFESGLEKLESIVTRLEEGSLNLDESLNEFEQGMKLYKNLAGQLDKAKQRVEVLLKDGENVISTPFDSDTESQEE